MDHPATGRVSLGLAVPEHRVDAEFVHFVDEHHQIMTEHLAKRFVDHRGVGLTAQRVSEFSLHQIGRAHV